MFETRSECSFFRMDSSSALLNLAPGGESTSEALLAQSKTADATRSAGRAGIFATRFGPLGEGGNTDHVKKPRICICALSERHTSASRAADRLPTNRQESARFASMLWAACTAVGVAAAVGTRSHSSFASVVGAVIDGDPPLRIRFVTAAFAERASFRLQRDESSFASDVDVRVPGARRPVALAALPIFSGSAGNGSWVHATLRRSRGLPATNSSGGWEVDAVVHEHGRLYAVVSSGTAPVRSHGDAADAVRVAVRVALLSSERPGRALTTSGLPPHGRLPGCPAVLQQASLGLVLDAGFVAAHGGIDPAIVAAATAISRTNAVFEDQLGLRLVVRVLIANREAVRVLGSCPLLAERLGFSSP